MLDRHYNVTGKIYLKEIEGIRLHMYEPHISHASGKGVFDGMGALIVRS